jgi:hypothetical protein
LTTSEALLLLFLGFWAVVGSIIISNDLFPYSRLIILVIASITFVVVGSLYYNHNKPKQRAIYKPLTSVPTKRERLREAFFVSLAIFESNVLLSMAVLTWQTVIISGVHVITYTDLLAIGLFALCLFVIRLLVRYFRSSEDEKRKFF